MSSRPIAAGKSSFELLDPSLLFAELEPLSGLTFLDVACGRGAYSLAASPRVRPGGRVVAVDLWEEGVAGLQREVRARKLDNVMASVSDVSRRIPVEDQSVDVCLLSTVLHDLIQDRTDEGTLREIVRVMKPGGRLAVVEFKKQDGPPGPPASVRLAPEELAGHLRPHGFMASRSRDLGPHLYLSLSILTA